MKIEISQHEEFVKYLKMGLDKSVHNALLSTATHLVQHINVDVIPNTKPFQPVDRGTYRAGWRVVPGMKVIRIINSVPQSVFIEDGVRGENVKPGRAMLGALAAWVKRKGLDVSGAKAKTLASKKESLSTSANPYMQAAWAIAMSMKKKGIFAGSATPSGYKILKRALLKFDSYFAEEMEREMKRNLK